MRIAHVAGTALPSRVASAVNVLKMCRSFAAGHEVTLHARGRQGDAAAVFGAYGLERGGFDLVLRAPPGLQVAKNFLYPAREAARRPAPDLLHGRHAYALAACAAALNRGRGAAPPLAYEAHAFPERPWRRLAEAWLFRRPRFSLLVAISRALAEDYGRRFPALAARRRTLVAHDGADPVAEADPPAAGPLPGRVGAPQLGWVGHLYPGKGVEMVAALAALLPECDLHAVGGTGRDLAHWRRRCAGLPDLRLHGFVPHGDVSRWLARFDLLLAPPAARLSSAAGREIGRWMSPRRVFEYMATGKPILASDIPALREIPRDGETALLLPPGEPEAWAAAARALLRDRGRAAAPGARARAALLAEYAWDARAARILERPRGGGAAA
jgi:glycosyltransferase involved in cell wall biosynthesis